jgi:hypothetical protein
MLRDGSAERVSDVGCFEWSIVLGLRLTPGAEELHVLQALRGKGEAEAQSSQSSQRS